jgi:hypothetical protein
MTGEFCQMCMSQTYYDERTEVSRHANTRALNNAIEHYFTTLDSPKCRDCATFFQANRICSVGAHANPAELADRRDQGGYRVLADT